MGSFGWELQGQVKQLIACSIDTGTRKEELLVDKATLTQMWVLRRILGPMGTIDAVEFLVDKMKYAKTNDDFWGSMNS